jgi:hypothetical protein
MLVKTGRKSRRQPGETRGRPRLLTVELTLPHCINGVRYGPGTTVVDEHLAALLAENEARSERTEHKLHQSRSGIITAAHRLITTPTEAAFDDAMRRLLSGVSTGAFQ